MSLYVPYITQCPACKGCLLLIYFSFVLLQVLAVTFDGASVNRRLAKLHHPQDDVYKVKNVHAPDARYLYFISDPPHLIKTTRNCWSSSTRLLWVRYTSFVKGRELFQSFPFRKMAVTLLGSIWCPFMSKTKEKVVGLPWCQS